ncbi:MAG TPA: hypothetical protein DG048_15740 [Pseudoalteromonas sp.]|jgi:hypothetical protein|nr:hypothetical protein [Pseudoalteromonas sp.]|tara:strand:- start:29220 stop:29429 length:210 start_codon:yes stop_codon:yes gene_type:complete
MEEIMSRANDNFTQGIVYAAARCIELCDEPTVATTILHEADVDREKACDVGTDSADLNFIDRADAWPKL